MRSLARPRGYLLLDIAIGGAIFALAVATIMSVLAGARARNTQAARDVVATQLVLDELERQQALGFAGVASAAAATVAGETGIYKRSVAVTGPTNETFGGVTLRYKSVQVTVTYDVANPAQPVRRSQATARVYQ